MYHKPSVIFIDDNEMLLNSYKYYIETSDEFNLLGTFTSVNSALREYTDLFPDIIVMDISMPETSGIEGIGMFKKIDQEVKILMATIHDDYEHILKSLKNEADGYITKPINRESLIKALNDLKGDGGTFSPKISKKIGDFFKRKEHALFSKRENEVIEQLLKGNSYKAIAEKLFISHSAVSFHLQNIYSKINVNNKADALEKLRKMFPTLDI